MAINGALVTPKKQQQTQVNVRTIYFCIFMPIFLRFDNYIEFLIQSLEIVRNVQNGIETRDNLCTEFGPPVNQLS